MRFSLPRFLVKFFLGLSLVGVMYACQASTAPQVTPPSTISTKSPPTELPSETTAILNQAGGKVLNPPRGDVRFLVISDLNSAYGSTSYDPEVDKGIKLVPFWQPDMVLCGGDMIAGQSPSLSAERLKEMWEAFDQQVAAPLRRIQIPYGFTIGNHDASSAVTAYGKFLFPRDRAAATEYWQNPAHDPGLQFVDRFEFPFYYTFEFKDIFFLAWDGSSSSIPAEKLAWVEKALASDKAKAAKLRILISHLPLYGVAEGRNQAGDVMDNAEQLRAMLEKYNVHTYISGHHHAYYPAHRGKLQLLHMGILGSGPRPYIEGGQAPRKSLTVIDVKFNSPELTTYTTYDIQTLQVIENQELPRMLVTVNGMILRRDIEAQALSLEERQLCESRLGVEGCHA
ncbi:MAG: metallophosphoesterase [Oscillatoriales cyanobacterium C42_A2020_001]|nr:metallophosphoesterase [Leptolyngbyaceae cyanobacterium C42_A2020_001]